MLPEPTKFYQHRYGGVYQVIDVSSSTVDKSRWVVYEHIYPFEEGQVWHRPYDEFVDGRFRVLTWNEFRELRDRDREKFQAEITANKEAAKGKA